MEIINKDQLFTPEDQADLMFYPVRVRTITEGEDAGVRVSLQSLSRIMKTNVDRDNSLSELT